MNLPGALLLAALVSRPADPQEAGDPRMTIPAASAQKEQETLIRGVFRTEYTRAAPGDRRALALKLLDQALGTTDNPVARFVLLREARDLAAESGDPETSLKAIDQMAQEYRVAPLPMKATVLAGALKTAKTVDDFRRLSAAYLGLTTNASDAEDMDLAAQSAARAAGAARSARDPALVARAESKQKEVGELKGRVEQLRKARATLDADPSNPEAGTAVGEYLVLVKEDWAAGLPLLARGSEHSLRDLARQDVSLPASSADQIRLADAWWEQSEREKGRLQEVLRHRALYWYQTALPDLSGVLALKVSQRIASVAPPWMTRNLFAWWRLDEGTGGVISDGSGNRRGGKIEGATWAKGMIGSSLHFDGNHQKVLLDAGEIPPPWTAVVWVKREENPNHTARLLDGTSYEKGSSLRLEQSTNTHQVGITKYRVVDHAFDYKVPVGVWVQLAWVGTPKNVFLYANDKLVGTADLATPLSVDRLGSQDQMGLRGFLDEIRIYSRDLSASEVEALYHYSRR